MHFLSFFFLVFFFPATLAIHPQNKHFLHTKKKKEEKKTTKQHTPERGKQGNIFGDFFFFVSLHGVVNIAFLIFFCE